MAARTVTVVAMLPTTVESIDVNACCAPWTSPFRRLTRAPVWVRLKNAIGCFWTWSKTCVRRSWTRLCPIRADTQRWVRPMAAATTTSPAVAAASATTSPERCCRMPSSMIALNNSGWAAPASALSRIRRRKTAMSDL